MTPKSGGTRFNSKQPSSVREKQEPLDHFWSLVEGTGAAGRRTGPKRKVQDRTHLHSEGNKVRQSSLIALIIRQKEPMV
jgi:hypothetical protein